MTTQTLRDRTHQRPFRPSELHLANGDRYPSGILSIDPINELVPLQSVEIKADANA